MRVFREGASFQWAVASVEAAFSEIYPVITDRLCFNQLKRK